MSDQHVLHLTEANFQTEVVDSQLPVLVDFWAPWCGPCRMLAPTIETLAEQYTGKARVGKVNVDDNQQLAANYRVEGIPTVIVYKGGEEVDRLVGVQPADAFAAALDRHTAAG